MGGAGDLSGSGVLAAANGLVDAVSALIPTRRMQPFRPARVVQSRFLRPASTSGATPCGRPRGSCRGAANGFDLFGVLELGDGGELVGRFKLAGGRRGVDLGGGNRRRSQDSHHVVSDLGEAAIDKVTVHFLRRSWFSARQSQAGRSRAPDLASRLTRRRRAEGPRSRPIRRTTSFRASPPRTGFSCAAERFSSPTVSASFAIEIVAFVLGIGVALQSRGEPENWFWKTSGRRLSETDTSGSSLTYEETGTSG